MGKTEAASEGQPSARRLPRAQRREQILASATQAFAKTGFTATSLEDIAAKAGVSRMILYRHFESKADLYIAVLDRAQRRLLDATGAPEFTMASVDGLIAAAAEDPAAFRLLFRHAAREPEFRQHIDEVQRGSVEIAHEALVKAIGDSPWARWASNLLPSLVIEAVIAWLDAGQPDRVAVADKIRGIVEAVVAAASPDR
jgi:AcrR family transcriptional regulator